MESVKISPKKCKIAMALVGHHTPPSQQEALQLAKIVRLEDRRNELCIRTFNKITKAGPCQKHASTIRTISLESLTRLLNEKSSFLGESSSLVLFL